MPKIVMKNRFSGKYELGLSFLIYGSYARERNVLANSFDEALRNLAKKYNVDMPIVNAAYKVLFENKPAGDAVWDLMCRSEKREDDYYYEKNN